MNQINKRSVLECVILTIITLGIYGIYWMYLLVQSTRSMRQNTMSCIMELLCIMFVPFYALYWWYTRGESVKQGFEMQNRASSGNGTVYLVLSLFGLGIISMAIMQTDFNSLTVEAYPNRQGVQQGGFYLYGLSGPLTGRKYRIDGRAVIGRDASRCNVTFPVEQGGVSQVHCEVKVAGNTLYLTDLGSTCGTFLGNGIKIDANTPVVLSSGSKFWVGDSAYVFQVQY